MLIRKFVFFVLMLLYLPVHSQEYQKDRPVFLKDYNLYFSSYVTMGDNMFHEAHRNPGFGYELKIGVAEYKNIGLSVFYKDSSHSITDTQLIGDFSKTCVSGLGVGLRYHWSIGKRFSLKPEIGYYRMNLKDYSYSKKAYYDGSSYYLGADFIYYLSKHFGVGMALQYHHANLKTTANPSYKDYFSDVRSLQFNIGIHIR